MNLLFRSESYLSLILLYFTLLLQQIIISTITVYKPQQIIILIKFKRMSLPKKYHFSSSESEDDSDDQQPQINYQKSAVFNIPSSSYQTIPEERTQYLEESVNQINFEDNLLKPKMKAKEKEKSTIATFNASNLLLKHAISESKIPQKPLVAAYTFKLKTPLTKRKKNDPVSLFQQTTTMWKKDKFLTNRANNKEGRKLELEKRNKETKVIV